MNQKHSDGDGESADKPDDSPSNLPSSRSPFDRPGYMTVGSGSASANAAALMASLDHDSGYGGSIAGSSDAPFNIGLGADRPTPSHTPVVNGEYSEAALNERRILQSHLHQLQFNQNRASLARSITKTIELLKDLQQENAKWPAHYPSTAQKLVTEEPRPGITHTQSNIEDLQFPSRPSTQRRATTSESVAESSTAAERRPAPEPRLFTPQIQNDFSVLKLNLNMGAIHQADLVHSLGKEAIAELLDNKIRESVRHLLLLRDRIEDTSSKVLVTGDLNAGKSTFCNALLRRKILPEDQQPCTSIFCEVVDARENGNIEEVHAIHKYATYNRNDESTYDVYTLDQLEEIVTDNQKYNQCKVYVKDIRKVGESLLNNGVVDISIIDAPGLNSDSIKTTAVFARQEEIDVVVFVVSAANHFTLSAKEFIWNAAHEKAYIFMVVNGFDNIRDKKRCERMILEQVANLSPRTFKESSELVHFVSSNSIPVFSAMPAGHPGDGPGGPGSGSGSAAFLSDNNPWNDDPSRDKGKGKATAEQKHNAADFAHLEASLRRFVLEKRSRSKLFPAKTYLLNLLNDIWSLCSVNRDVAHSELERVSSELGDLEPQFTAAQQARRDVADDAHIIVDDTYTDVYDHTVINVTNAIQHIGEESLGVPYPGIFSAWQYAEDLKHAMIEHIKSTVLDCEDYARKRSETGVTEIKRLGVNAIKCMGLRNVGESFPDLNFKSKMMFTRQRHIEARDIDFSLDLWDFFDLNALWEKQEKVAGTSMAVTVAGIVGGRLIGGASFLDSALGVVKIVGINNMKRLFIPGLIGLVAIGGAYFLHLLPTTLPITLMRKLSDTLLPVYPHANASRIASEVRKVLNYPTVQLSSELSKNEDSLRKKRDELQERKGECGDAKKWFTNMVREVEGSRRGVANVELETVG